MPLDLQPVLFPKGASKIAFKAKTSEFIASKAEGRNRPEAMLFIVEDLFWPDNEAGGERSRLQPKWIVRGSLKCNVVMYICVLLDECRSCSLLGMLNNLCSVVHRLV